MFMIKKGKLLTIFGNLLKKSTEIVPVRYNKIWNSLFHPHILQNSKISGNELKNNNKKPV